MEKKSKLFDIVNFITALSFIIWFGSYLIRLLSVFLLYDPHINKIIPESLNIDLNTFFIFLSQVILIQVIFYMIFIITFILSFLNTKFKLRSEGWLFIIVIIILASLPFELFLLTFDVKVIIAVFHDRSSFDEVLKLVIKREELLGGFPIIELFLYTCGIYLFLNKPFRISNL